MISKMFRISLTIVVASLALSSSALAATCSNASVSGLYGSLGEGTSPQGQPEANLFQFNLDPSTGTFSGTDQTGASVTGTYEVASNCTVTGTTTKGRKHSPLLCCGHFHWIAIR